MLDRLAVLAGIEPRFSDYFGNVTEVGDDTKAALLRAMGFDVSREDAIAGAIAQLEAGDAPPSIAGPQRCYLAPEMERGRIWALATQLYALRSDRNWGIGDFTDLETLAALAGAAGAGAIALNPLHALHWLQPQACSPYSPTSRRWLNPLYVDVTRVEDFAESEAAAAAAQPSFVSELQRLRATPLVDFAGVARLKTSALERMFASFCRRHLERPGDARAKAFRAFVRDGGGALARFAAYHALAEYFYARDGSFGWLQWPAAYRSPDSADAVAFARARADRVAFFSYLQWIADEQLAIVARTASRAGVGLYRDLAVGVDRNGADAWSDPSTILESVSLGAPPDAMNALGQNWGLPPLSPPALRRGAYAPLIELLRANMRHATILRIDHVMALRRAFWIPLGRTPREGAYVDYRFDEMLAAVAAESERNRCSVVGEDLGTVPDGFRERMREAGTLSSRLLYFERDFHSGAFRPPPAYPRLAAASVGTHDLPPLAGWWTGADLTLRGHIGLFPDDASAAGAAEERRHARFVLVDALEREGACDGSTAQRLRDDARAGGTAEAAAPLTAAAYRYLAMTPACLIVVAIEDVLGDVEAVNVPGTTVEHPNWQRKHIRSLEEIAGQQLLAGIGEIVRA